MSSEPFADGVVRVNHPKSLYLNKPGGNRAAVDYVRNTRGFVKGLGWPFFWMLFFWPMGRVVVC